MRFLTFLGDAVLSACYHISCMPSSVNKISHSILFSYEPIHHLPLKDFESTCFVHSFSVSLDKLSLRSHKCVFLRLTRS